MVKRPNASRVFQSTLPVKGATSCTPRRLGGWLFQSTLPVKGATRGKMSDWHDGWFQSTLPVKGATPLEIAFVSAPSSFNPRSR